MKGLNWKHLLLFFLIVKLGLHLLTNGSWSFHRDELLYLALGRRLDWGFASVPPGIAAWAWIGNHWLGGSIETIRLLSTLAGIGTVALSGLIVMEMLPPDRQKYPGTFAMTLVGLSGLLCGAFLRPCMMFQPVVFDIFYWTLSCWLFLKYQNTGKSKWLIGLGISVGLGLLNKYSLLILLAALVPGVLFTSQRRLLKDRSFYLAAAIALVIWSPNLWWQMTHGLPVFGHMRELAATQFVHVSFPDFLADQILFFLPALPIWLFGIGFLLQHPAGRSWRTFAWMYFGVLLILLLFRAKSYYALGAYPVLIAAGAVHLERLSANSRRWIRTALPALMLLIGLPLMPMILPMFPPEKTIQIMSYAQRVPGLAGSLRWEDGRFYSLPQDFADMCGWQELAAMVGAAWQAQSDPETVLVYAEHYGQAGAIEQLGSKYGIKNVMSFSDNYRYWLPDSLPARFNTLLYINDELGDDMPGFFTSIEKAGEVHLPYSRQHGDQVYVCKNPTPAFFQRLESAIFLAKNNQPIE